MPAVFRSAFTSIQDEHDGSGRRPVIFDIIGPDWTTSILPDDLKMVLHVNPSSMKFSYSRAVERIQTKGGWVEQHWGEKTQEINFDMVSGGFMRLYSGLSNTTNPAYGGTRRDTIAYDKYLDMLALFHNNGCTYDLNGQVFAHGLVKCTFDGGSYFGWFSSFSVEESAEKPYLFSLSAAFIVDHEVMSYRSTMSSSDIAFGSENGEETANG